MLNLCESFTYSYGLKFNASKTQLIRFGLSLSNTCNARIVFCGEQLVFLNTVCHLGHHLSYNLSDDEDINRKLECIRRRREYPTAIYLPTNTLYVVQSTPVYV